MCSTSFPYRFGHCRDNAGTTTPLAISGPTRSSLIDDSTSENVQTSTFDRPIFKRARVTRLDDSQPDSQCVDDGIDTGASGNAFEEPPLDDDTADMSLVAGVHPL